MAKKRSWLFWTVGTAAAVLVGVTVVSVAGREAGATEITVYKTPACGCCTKWVDHLRSNGFDVTTLDLDNLSAVKAQHGVTANLASCHTAIVDGYVVEGHVPADVISRLLVERPNVTGIAVPGMPAGSPGMEGPYSEGYEVLAFDRQGNTSVYARR